ncbi:MAG: hypothetical protein J3R72DRAFT_221609 [Linnemannia gamsii]|nr:MAG: hypothetical protein J3R72DRAFT_221609 [Linnemannia gamsii]
MVAVSSSRLGLILSLSTLFTLSTTNAQAPKPPATGTAPPPTGTPVVPPPTTPGPTIDAPSAFFGLASVSNKKMIYYQGGQLNQAGGAAFTADFFSLDLTKSWPKSTPAWVNLSKPASGTVTGPQVGGHSAALSADGASVLVTAPVGDGTKPFLYSYNIAAGSWSTVNAPSAQATSWASRKNADLLTDAATGTTWLLGGSSPDGTSTNEVDSYKDGQWTPLIAVTAAGGGTTPLNQFSAGTAELYNSKIYIFGGFSSSVGSRGYQSFQSIPFIDISTSPPTHGIQLALGKVPPSRQDHCTVLTDSKKVLLFGGYDANAKTSLSDMWSFDLITTTWTQILVTNPIDARHAHSCSIAGANMIVFGGMSITPTGQRAYVKDVQVYDVMLSKWMGEYAPKADGTAISEPLGGSGAGSSGLSSGALIGIIIGAIAVLGLIIGFFLYRRRQKQIEIREAEMEKEAYLASLRPEGDLAGGDSKISPRMSPNAARAALGQTPGMVHAGAYAGMDEMLLHNAAGSPGMGGQGNVQYLMQHLPDGTIAVQPVYLDHTGGVMQMQSPSPNMQALALNSSTPLDQGYISPPTNSGPSGYFSPPPPTNANVTSPITTQYVLPPTTGGGATPMVTYPQVAAVPPSHSQDPFASPLLGNAPMPPGYNPSSPGLGASGLGSPQQMHPDYARQNHHQ